MPPSQRHPEKAAKRWHTVVELQTNSIELSEEFSGIAMESRKMQFFFLFLYLIYIISFHVAPCFPPLCRSNRDCGIQCSGRMSETPTTRDTCEVRM